MMGVKVLGGVGATFLLGFAILMALQYEYLFNGVATEGKIVSLWGQLDTSFGRKVKYLAPTAEYRAQRRTYTLRVDARRPDQYSVNDKLPVVYLRNQPEVAIVGEKGVLWVAPALCGIVGVLCVLASLWVSSSMPDSIDGLTDEELAVMRTRT